MIFIALHKDGSTRFVNLNTVSMISADGGITKICFDGDQYITVDESLDDVAKLIVEVYERFGMIRPKKSRLDIMHDAKRLRESLTDKNEEKAREAQREADRRYSHSRALAEEFGLYGGENEE